MTTTHEVRDALLGVVSGLIETHGGKPCRAVITLQFRPGQGIRAVVEEPDESKPDGRRSWRTPWMVLHGRPTATT
jgi:hypothetical protein